MRLTASSLMASLLLASHASARQANVYIVDPEVTTRPRTSASELSASDARLVFAHRLGLSEFHSLASEGLNIPAIEALNLFGGRSENLFGSQAGVSSKSIVFVEGFNHVSDVLPLNTYTSAFRFAISDLPSAEANLKFVEDLREQYDFLSRNDGNSADRRANFEMIRKGHSGSDEEVKDQLLQLVGEESNAIVVFTDASYERFTSRPARGWGSYRSIQKRQLDFSSGRPDITPETSVDPLEIDIVPSGEGFLDSDPQSSSPVLDWIDLPADAKQDEDGGRNTTAPRGILPKCFATESSCKKTTNDCSGHGSCQSSYKYQEGGKTIECYACKCNATVKSQGDRKSTTYWSGPACQKKDVSSPFWLLSGITIGLLLVVTWGIGLLYSMGQEELPSVIGAGVSGPRPK